MTGRLTIKYRLIATLLSTFLASSACIGYFSYQNQLRQMRGSMRKMARNEGQLFQTILKSDAEGLARAQSGLVRLDALTVPFAARNRAELLAAAEPVFAELKQEHHITHMYFIGPDGTVFLRVHRPEQFGDRLNRATFKRSVATGKTASGIEMGLNFFSLRCVEPVYHRGVLIGYLEIAEEVDHVFTQMKAITGNDVGLFLPREYLDRYGVNFDVDRVGGFALLYPTNRGSSVQLAHMMETDLPKGLVDYSIRFLRRGNDDYVVAAGPFADAFGEVAGVLFSHREITQQRAAIWQGIFQNIAVFAVIFLACSGMLYLSMRRSIALFNALREHILMVTRTWDLTRRLEVETNDEVGELVGEFNLMKDEIEKLKNDLEQRAEELSASNRDLEAFNYTLSHDLRLPLTRIYTSAQVLRDEYAGQVDETGAYLITSLIRACEDMEELIEAILTLSQVSRSEMRLASVNLGELVEEIGREQREREPERRVELTVASDLHVHGDESLLKVAIQNLIENAWKYTRLSDQPRIDVGVVDRGGQSVYFVRDNGIGFDMKDSAGLFEPFRRLPEAKQFPGTGVGLATVKRVITRHGGEIWAEGERGRGATFFFTVAGS